MNSNPTNGQQEEDEGLLQPQDNPKWMDGRRSFLLNSCCIGTVLCYGSTAANAAEKKQRIQGAAEYDLEFYLRDVFKGNNNREGNLPISDPPPSIPPRTLLAGGGPLSPSLLPLLLNEDCDEKCIAVRELAALLPPSITTDVISSKVMDIRSKASRSFATACPWEKELISDQYYFDLTSYALYRVAADLIPTDYVKRNTWIRNTGKAILKEARKQGILSSSIVAVNDNKSLLTSNIPGIMEILDTFNVTQFYSNYRLGEQPPLKGEEKGVSSRVGKNVFDEYDDQDIAVGTTVNCLVSMFQPATLQSSLQITGEGSRFAPDFVGAILSAYWEELGLSVQYETYFVDPEYRPNPKDYFPNEQLLQFSLTFKKK